MPPPTQQSCDEIAPSHCLPQAQDHAEFADRLRLSEQEIVTREMGFSSQFAPQKFEPRKTASGHSRHFGLLARMSALPR